MSKNVVAIPEDDVKTLIAILKVIKIKDYTTLERYQQVVFDLEKSLEEKLGQ